MKVIFIIASLIRRNSITEKVNGVRNTKRATEVRDKWMNMCKYAKQRFGELDRESKKIAGEGLPPTSLSQSVTILLACTSSEL